MKIESKNMAMGTQSLQQMARDYQWWDPSGTPNGRSLSNEEVIFLKAIKKYTKWPLKEVAKMMGVPYHNIIKAVRLRDPVLVPSRIPEYFYEATGMVKGKNGPEGTAKNIKAGNQALSDEDVAVIRELHKKGHTVEDIAAAFNKSIGYTGTLIRGDSRHFLSADPERVKERMVTFEKLLGDRV
ncbi:hypothetical protein VIK251_00195 [Klebsiella phage vB_KpnM_VIK251]|jgi:hypothetical protein|uniref:Uncharacterized protein n=1 Tax=Proteus phage Mydo TaxID=2483610 RepID=A0A3G8F0R8_9CAUD|nr:hypothetical protein HWB97_gp098 [Proteus phage Mydo]AZF87673.1 hypothetical protein CPT_Mydo_098 [Proteus phage Mydo]UKS71522.1 hypothetical protein VIK251_00195 [Klebsiella phage vB_KpnM_VIK251]UVX29932.1 endonuclease [Klebsiella phage VLCpiM5a]